MMEKTTRWQDVRYDTRAEMAIKSCTDKEYLGPWYPRYRHSAQEDTNDLLPGNVTQSRTPIQSRK